MAETEVEKVTSTETIVKLLKRSATTMKKDRARKASRPKVDPAVKEAADRAEETARRKRAAEALEEDRAPGDATSVQ